MGTMGTTFLNLRMAAWTLIGSGDGDDAGDFEPMTRKPRANKRKAPTGGAAKKKGKKKGKK
jgi:hypothetical protein